MGGSSPCLQTRTWTKSRTGLGGQGGLKRTRHLRIEAPIKSFYLRTGREPQTDKMPFYKEKAEALISYAINECATSYFSDESMTMLEGLICHLSQYCGEKSGLSITCFSKSLGILSNIAPHTRNGNTMMGHFSHTGKFLGSVNTLGAEPISYPGVFPYSPKYCQIYWNPESDDTPTSLNQFIVLKTPGIPVVGSVPNYTKSVYYELVSLEVEKWIIDYGFNNVDGCFIDGAIRYLAKQLKEKSGLVIKCQSQKVKEWTTFKPHIFRGKNITGHFKYNGVFIGSTQRFGDKPIEYFEEFPYHTYQQYAVFTWNKVLKLKGDNLTNIEHEIHKALKNDISISRKVSLNDFITA